MMADMGCFRVLVEIENLAKPGASRSLPDVLVDTGSYQTWIPRPLLQELGIGVQRQMGFILGDGRVIERDIGHALSK